MCYNISETPPRGITKVDKNFYLNHLDQLTDRERTIFLYRIVLKVPTEETAKRLRVPVREVKDTTRMLQEQAELLFIKSDLLEAYQIGI